MTIMLHYIHAHTYYIHMQNTGVVCATKTSVLSEDEYVNLYSMVLITLSHMYYQHCHLQTYIIIMLEYTLFCSGISVILVGMWCVPTAPITSYPSPFHHPNLKESVTDALMLYQLTAKMKVRMIAAGLHSSITL